MIAIKDSGIRSCAIENIKKLNKVLEGVEMTEEENKTFLWLAGWEGSTVDNIVAVIKRITEAKNER